MRFVPYHLVGDRPNIVVDGPGLPSSVLTLSHWPATTSPPELAADLSAHIALRYLAQAGRWPRADLVSNDHLDQDGLAALFALVRPEEALERRQLLGEVASAGDFATFADRDAAGVSFALACLADPDRTTLPPSLFPVDHWERCGGLYEELLGTLPELLARPGRHRRLWGEELASFLETERAFDAGRVRIEEHAGLDLAVVRIPEGSCRLLATRFASRADAAVHPASVNNRTSCFRLVLVEGRRYELVYRYESWVRYTSRRPLARVDLAGLADRLCAEEPHGARWRFDGVGALEPRLRLDEGEESGIGLERFVSFLGDELRRGRPAWDPYRPAGVGALVT